MAYLVSFKIRY